MSPPHVLTIWYFGPLTAEIGWRVCGTTANFNGFRVLALLLHRCHSTEVNQTLHDVWPSHELVQYIYILGAACPLTEFCEVQNSLCVHIFRSPILAVLLHGTRAGGDSQTLRRGIRNEIKELSQTAPPVWQGGHHVGHRPTFLLCSDIA